LLASEEPLYRAGNQDSPDHTGAKQGRDALHTLDPQLTINPQPLNQKLHTTKPQPLNQKVYRAEKQRLADEARAKLSSGSEEGSYIRLIEFCITRVGSGEIKRNTLRYWGTSLSIHMPYPYRVTSLIRNRAPPLGPP